MFPVLKSVLVLDKRGATNGETVTANIDTLGADWMTLDVHSSTSNNTTNNPSTFKLSEGDTTDATAACTAQCNLGADQLAVRFLDDEDFDFVHGLPAARPSGTRGGRACLRFPVAEPNPDRRPVFGIPSTALLCLALRPILAPSRT